MDRADDDTIEMQLSAADLKALTQAAKQKAVTSVPVLRVDPRSIDDWQAGPSASTFITVVAGVLFVGALGYAVATRDDGPSVARAAIAQTPPSKVTHRHPQAVAAADAAVSEPQPEPPVRFANPFDKNEVFEFPPGTSEGEARERVAALLIERARDRMSSVVRVTDNRGGSFEPMPLQR